MSPWVLNVYMDTVERSENGDGEDWSEFSGGKRVEIAWPLLYEDDLVF